MHSLDSVQILAAFDPIAWVIGKIFDALGQLMEAAFQFVLTGSEPNLTNGWFSGQYDIMLRIGAAVTLPVAFIATIVAILKGGLREVLRTYLIGLPVAILGAVAAVGVVALAQSIDANLTDSVSSFSSENLADYVATVKSFDTDSQLGVLIVGFFVGMFMILALAFLWIELILRTMLIYLAVLFLPFGFAMFVWSSARRWLSTLIEIILVAVFAKFVTVAILGFGFDAVLSNLAGVAAGEDGAWNLIGSLISGLVIITGACFAMPAILAFVLGPSVVMAGRDEVMAKTPLSVASGRTAARGAAIRPVKAAGKALSGKG